MGLRPTQANENGFHQFFCPFLTELSSRPERSAVEGPAVSALPTHKSNLSHLSPFVIPTEGEGSVVRPAALSNPSWQGPGRTDTQPKSLPSTRFRNAGSQHSFVQQINPTESTFQLIWTALAESSPGR
jgi:hypothetical protein